MIARGHGKLILLGEHAVVYGEPALCGALGRGVAVVEERPAPALSIEVPSWSMSATAGDGSVVGAALAVIARGAGRPGKKLLCDADLPVGAGLGASAALCAATARALLEASAGDGAVEALAAAADEVIHGRASGVDAAVATRGGLGLFRRGAGFASLPRASLEVVVLPTGRGHSTREMVDRVARLRQDQPGRGEALCRRIGMLAAEGGRLLASAPDDRHQPRDQSRERLRARLGVLLDENQALLGELGVSTPELDAACRVARDAGALGAKLTGAGGGGCAFALPREGDAARLHSAIAGRFPASFVARLGEEA